MYIRESIFQPNSSRTVHQSSKPYATFSKAWQIGAQTRFYPPNGGDSELRRGRKSLQNRPTYRGQKSRSRCQVNPFIIHP